MRTRTTLGLAAAVPCAALVTAVGIGRGGDGRVASSLTAPPNGPYVALGDSCTAAPKTNQAQLSAVSTATRLVTPGIGGNDIRFSSLITTCVQAGVRYQLGEAHRGPGARRHRRHRSEDRGGGRPAGVPRDVERRAPEETSGASAAWHRPCSAS